MSYVVECNWCGMFIPNSQAHLCKQMMAAVREPAQRSEPVPCNDDVGHICRECDGSSKEEPQPFGAIETMLERMRKLGGSMCAVNLAEPTSDDLPRVYAAYREMCDRYIASQAENARLRDELTKALTDNDQMYAEHREARIADSILLFKANAERNALRDELALAVKERDLLDESCSKRGFEVQTLMAERDELKQALAKSEKESVELFKDAADLHARELLRISAWTAQASALAEALKGYDCVATRNNIIHMPGVVCARCEVLAAFEAWRAGGW